MDNPLGAGRSPRQPQVNEDWVVLHSKDPSPGPDPPSGSAGSHAIAPAPSLRSASEPLAPVPPPHNSATPTAPASVQHVPVVCRYYKQGFCKDGSSCPYLHQMTDAPGSATEPYLAKKLGWVERHHCKAAGVLPYRRNGGQLEILLGREYRPTDMAVVLNVLGGKRSMSKDSNIEDTAVREFWEESARVVGSRTLQQMLADFQQGAVDVAWIPHGKFALYCYHWQQEWDIDKRFLAVDRTKLADVEMKELFWIPLPSFLAALREGRPLPLTSQLRGQLSLQLYSWLRTTLHLAPLLAFLERLVDPQAVGPASGPAVKCEACRLDATGPVRFKCADCPNYWLCEKCIVRRTREQGHPLQHLYTSFPSCPDLIALRFVYIDSNTPINHILALDRSELVHPGCACHHCQRSPIVGILYSCTHPSCGPNLQICEQCEAHQMHPGTHVLLKKKTPGPP